MIELPEVFSMLWEDFLMLNSSRTSNGFGVNPLQYSEIKAYYDLIDYRVQPWEIEVLKVFDSTALKVYSDKAEKESKKKNK